MVSGKFSLKNASNFGLSFNEAKEFSPSKGIKSVHVKLPSRLGSAINIYFPLGQICSECLSNL